jgi:hypothetical protein
MFRQGAFGFAPRVVVLQGDRVALDEDVPFRTVREGPQGIAFVRDFEIEKEKLTVRAVLTLEDLNDEMKGHPRLEMRVERDGKPFAVGTLKPGEFAAAPEDYRLGFAGLKRWSEIDFSRRTYDLPVRIALGVMVAGLLLWPVAAWRRW